MRREINGFNWRQGSLWALATLGLISLFVFLRLNLHPDIINMDEFIVLDVSHGMNARRDLDTNWALAPTNSLFKYPQYNFSAYNLVGHAILSAVSNASLDILALRTANLVFQALAVIVVALAMRNAGIPRFGVLCTALLLAAAPGLVHDAQMLRTESLIYLLFAIVVWCATSPRPLLQRVVVAGLAIGFGAASKITFLASGLVMAPVVLVELCKAPRSGVFVILAAAAASALGFALGAPYALIHPDAYFHGLGVLNRQYSGSYAPHALMTYTPWAQAYWMASFFTILYGPLLLGGVASIGLAKRPPHWGVGLWLSAVATFLWFVHERTFFERNLSLVVVSAAILVGWLCSARPRVAGILTALSLAPMIWWSNQILEETLNHYQRRNLWEQAHGLQGVDHVFAFTEPPEALATCNGALAIIDLGDEWTDRTLSAMDARGARRLVRYEGRFHIVPVSTLQSYLDPDVVYYACRS